MSSIEIPRDQVAKQYPKILKEIEKEAAKKLSRSKAKKKGKSIKELKWFICWGTEIRCDHNIEDIFSGRRAVAEAQKAQRTLEEKLADEVSRTQASIQASMIGAYVHRTLDEVPQVLVDHIRNSLLENEAETQRINSMSDEERAEEVEEILKQLRGPGFFEL